MNESITKINGRGRMRYSPEQKKTMVDAYRASGLSAPRFASQHGVSYQTLLSWIKKEKIHDANASPRAIHTPLLSLVAAEIDTSRDIVADRGMEVLLPGGAKLVVTSPGQATLAAALIRELNPSRPC